MDFPVYNNLAFVLFSGWGEFVFNPAVAQSKSEEYVLPYFDLIFV